MTMLHAPEIFESANALGRRIAAMLLYEYKRKGKLTVGIQWGTTPIPVFDAFSEMVSKGKINLSGFHIVTMDEYVIASGKQFEYPPAGAPYSGHSHIHRDLLEKLPRAQAKILGNNVHFPNPKNPESFDKQISGMGGVDFFMVAVGAHDGHVAMCGAGTSLSSRTRRIRIPESVRDYNFDKLHSYFSEDRRKVPKFGVSIGLGTILDSRKLLFVAHGSGKAGIVRMLYAAKKFDESLPITFLWEATEKTSLFVDKEVWREK